MYFYQVLGLCKWPLTRVILTLTRGQWRSSNLFSLVIQGDTRTFELTNWLNKVRPLLWCCFLTQFRPQTIRNCFLFGPFLGFHYRLQSRQSLTLPDVLKNSTTFSTFCLWTWLVHLRYSVKAKFRKLHLIGRSASLKIHKFQPFDNRRKPRCGQNWFLTCSKAKIKNWKINKVILIHVYQTLFTNKK